MKRLIVLVWLAFVPVLIGATYYVNQSGSGSRNGTSLANAWSASDFNASGSTVVAGDTVYFYGTFTTKITAPSSGISTSNRITYAAGTSPVLVGIDGSSKSYLAIIGLTFTQTSTSNSYPEIKLNNSNGWLIQGNSFTNSYYDAIGANTGSNSYNTIRANSFNDIGAINGGSGGGGSVVNINVTGDYNLIDYNTVIKGMDRTRVFGTYNIVRNNYFGPTDTTYYPNSSPYPSHTDDLQSYDTPFSHIVYERNFSYSNLDSIGGTNSHGFLYQLYVTSANPVHFVYRFNVVSQVGGGLGGLRSLDYSYNFNNTWVQIQYGSSSQFQQACGFESPTGGSGNGPSNYADVRNNTLTDSIHCRDTNGFYGNNSSSVLTNFSHGTNHTYDYGAAEAAYPTFVAASPANLSKVDPLFVNRNTLDYHLTSPSPLRSAGSTLVTAVGSGTSSTSLTVNNAYPIIDGFGIADGDLIKVGSSQYVQVTSVNYSTNVITLATAVSWSNGDQVFINGMQDVGALPYGSANASIASSKASSPRTNMFATITVVDSSNVRFVQVLQDGIPVVTSSSPVSNVYTVSWTSDGQSHTLVSRAYNYWSSSTPYNDTNLQYGTLSSGMTGKASLVGSATIK